MIAATRALLFSKASERRTKRKSQKDRSLFLSHKCWLLHENKCMNQQTPCWIKGASTTHWVHHGRASREEARHNQYMKCTSSGAIHRFIEEYFPSVSHIYNELQFYENNDQLYKRENKEGFILREVTFPEYLGPEDIFLVWNLLLDKWWQFFVHTCCVISLETDKKTKNHAKL